MKKRRTRWFVVFVAGLFQVPAHFAAAQGVEAHHDGGSGGRSAVYFDAHSLSYPSVLPFYVYADPPKFLQDPSPRAITVGDRQRLWKSLLAWSRRPPGEAATRAVEPRTRALLEARGRPGGAGGQGLNAVLARVLTATPEAGSASAYALRKVVESEYLERSFGEYHPNPDLKNYRLLHDLCSASLLQMAGAGVVAAETTIDFTDGWQINPIEFRSDQEQSVLCFMRGPSELTGQPALKGSPVPDVRVLLGVDAGKIARAEAAGGSLQNGGTIRCESSAMIVPVPVDLLAVSNALMGKEEHGCEIAEFLEDAPGGGVQMTRLYSTLAGIDIGGIKGNCFNPSATDYCKELVRVVYGAAKARRKQGWHGKLLARFDLSPRLAGSGVEANGDAGPDQLKSLLAAVQELEQELVDFRQYVVLRAGGLAGVHGEDARRMAELGVEADIRLESRGTRSRSCAGQRRRTVGPAQSMLRSLLLHRVRVLLSTNGAGVEGCDAADQYRLAGFLISYWNGSDSVFRHRAISRDAIFANARRHLEALKSDSDPR